MSTGLRAGTNNDGYLQVNGTDVLTALSSGNIGIGITNPSAALFVQSSSPSAVLKLADTTATSGYHFAFGWADNSLYHRMRTAGGANDGFIIENIDSKVSQYFAYSGDWYLSTNSSTRLTVTSTGNVGIGTATPSNTLQIQVGDPSSLSNSSNGVRVTDGTRNVQVLRTGSSYSYGGVTGTGSIIYSYDKLSLHADTNNPIIFATGNSERLRITSSGTLESYSPDDSTQNFKYRSNDVNWHGYLNQSVEGGTIANIIGCGGAWDANGSTYNCTKDYNGSFPAAGLAIQNQYNSAQYARFSFLSKAGGSTTTDGSVSEWMTIYNGNVGINTGNPSRKFHVKSSVNNNDGALRIESATDNIMDMGTDLTGHFLNCVSNDPFKIKFAGTERIRVSETNGLTGQYVDRWFEFGIQYYNAGSSTWGSNGLFFLHANTPLINETGDKIRCSFPSAYAHKDFIKVRLWVGHSGNNSGQTWTGAVTVWHAAYYEGYTVGGSTTFNISVGTISNGKVSWVDFEDNMPSTVSGNEWISMEINWTEDAGATTLGAFGLQVVESTNPF